MIEQRVTLRYDAQQIPAIVQAVQGDTGRDVIFELADYEIPAGATANYYIDKPDGNAIYNSAEVISSTEIRAHLTEQALAAPGRNNGQVRILADGEVITSFDFVLEVEAFRGILRLQSETEINIFDQAIEDAVNTATEEAVAEIQAQTPVVTGMQNSIAPTYSASSTYAVGDYVMYNAQLYKCITAITTEEAWTAEHWTHVPVTGEVKDLRNSLSNDIVKKSNMEMFDLETIPASANRIDEEKYIHGKKINWAYGQVTDDASNCLYYLDVNPGDTVYFWRLHNNNVISAFSDGIAAFDVNGDFIIRGGNSGYTYSYTIPQNVYKLGLNFLESFMAAGDRYMAIINDPENPMEYIPFRNANDVYLLTNQSSINVDYNRLLPMSCKLPEDGFIKSYGHAGLSAYYPLDTAPSIIGAKKAGLSGTEIDVQITLDGVYVLFHDADLRRVGGTQQQTIGNMTYEQLQAFDYGAWFNPKFEGTELCTLDKAAQLCRELGLEIQLDCKTLTTQEHFLGAKAILDKWGMFEKSFWVTGSFYTIWTAMPDAKVVFPAGNRLTGATWDDPDIGWFESFNSNFPEDKKAYKDGMPIIPDGVYFGVSQNYTLMETDYGIEGLRHESELAKERNIKYGFYAVDDIEIIAELSEEIPYQSYLASNAISYQNAMNAHYGITKADYII